MHAVIRDPLSSTIYAKKNEHDVKIVNVFKRIVKIVKIVKIVNVFKRIRTIAILMRKDMPNLGKLVR